MTYFTAINYKQQNITNTSPAEVSVTAPRNEFSKFSFLPLELQLMVWRAAYTPRKIHFATFNDAPRMPTSMTNLRLACQDSNQIFLNNYTPCFANTNNKEGIPRNPTYVNFEIDTISLIHGLELLAWLAEEFPEQLSKVKRIEVSTYNQAGQDIWGPYMLCGMDLSCLSSNTTITVKPDVGYIKYHGWSLEQCAADDLGVFFDRSTENYGSRIIFTLLCLRERIMHNLNSDTPYKGPKLAGLFIRPDNMDIVHTDVYFETCSDLSHVTWKCLDQDARSKQEDKAEASSIQVGKRIWDSPRDESGKPIDLVKVEHGHGAPGLYSRKGLEGPPDVFTLMFRELNFPASCE